MVDRTENMIELLKWLEWNIFRTRSHREPWDRGTDRCVRFLSHTGKNIVEATRTANSNNIPITNNNNKQQQQYRHVHMPYTAGYNSVVHTGNRNGKVLTVPPLSFMTIHHPTLFIFILTGETTTRLQASLGKKGNKKKKEKKEKKDVSTILFSGCARLYKLYACILDKKEKKKNWSKGKSKKSRGKRG